MAKLSKPSVGEALLDAIRRNPQLPGIGTTITRIVAMVDSDADSVQELRDIILADVHLTQRILGIANSVSYRLRDGSGVTTVSRAIVVIGFQQIKVVALAMLFVDQMPEREQATALKAELIQALHASLLARQMARQLAPDDQEKAGIAALLGNVAQLLLVLIDFDRFLEIALRMSNGASQASAATEVLGMTPKTLTEAILTSWGIPDTLVALSTALAVRGESKPAQRLERIVGLAKSTAQHLRQRDVHKRDALIADIRKQCTADGIVSAEAFDRWLAEADAQMAPIRALLESTIPEDPGVDDDFPDGSVISDTAPTTGQRNAVGKPVNSHELVLARLQDLTLLIAERQSLSAIFLTAMECLHTGFGYARSILLLRDARTSRMRARVWRGSVTKAQAARLEFDMEAPGDFIAAAIRRGSDVQIQNAHDASISKRLPAYFAAACPTTASFIILPIVLEDSPVGCILVSRDVAELGPITPEDMRLLRTVRGQIVLAMKTVK